MKRPNRILAPLSALALGLAAVAPLAMAPEAGAQPAHSKTLQPPRARTPDKPPKLGNIAAGLFILAIVVGASLIPSKRGHQD